MAATVVDANAYKQLSLMGRQYVEVEKEMRSTSEKLKSAKKRKRQLAAEVRFLRGKLRSFRRVPGLDGPSQVARALKIRGEPQFYEVEVQYADSSNTGAGAMDSMAFEYPPSSSDPRNQFSPYAFSRPGKLLAI